MWPGDLITRCPQCNTTFRIIENQLEVASGAVRCGSCLEIFAARNHLIEVGSTTKSWAESLTLDGDQYLPAHHEDGDLSADLNHPEDVLDSEADEPFFHEEDAHAHDKTSHDASFSDDESDMGLDGVSLATQSDEFRALDEISVLNLDADRDERDPNKKAVLDGKCGFPNEEGSQDDHPEVVSENEADAIDEQEVEGLFSEHLGYCLEAVLEEYETDRPGQLSDDIASESPSNASGSDEDLDDRPVAPSGVPEEIDAALFAVQIKRALDEQPPIDPMEDVEERPLRDVEQVSGWWWVVAALLVLFIPGQWLWLDRDIVAQDTVFRPVYVTLCRVVGCEGPAYNNPEQLTAGDLVVKQVPEKPGMLHVVAVIRNDSGFQQPFPDLYIRFSSMRGDAVAARRFAPSEYLAGEMTGVRIIPPQTEVRISLSVVDPGDQALGYSLELIQKGVPLG